jgi:hypothetical protein
MKRALLGLLVGCLTLGLASVVMAGNNDQAGVSLHVTKPPTKATRCDADAPSWHKQGGRAIDPRGKSCFQGQTGDFDVWVVVCNGSDSIGVAGVEFGINYDGAQFSGIDVSAWRNCGDLEFPQAGWPDAGTGNIVTWDPDGGPNPIPGGPPIPPNCQNQPAEFHGGGATGTGPGSGGGKVGQGQIGVPNSVIAIAGVFRVFINGLDQMEVTPRPVTGRLKVADCNAAEDDLTDALVPRGGIAVFCVDDSFTGYNYCADGALPAFSETTWGKIKSQYR